MTIFLLLLLLVFAGCDSDSDKNVTGDYVYTEPRDLKTVVVPPDSFLIDTAFKANIGGSSYTLAGKYEDIEAFSVFKFPVGNIRRDNIIDAYVTFDLESAWFDGEASFDLHETSVDWGDSTTLDPDFFIDALGTPLSTASDTSSALAALKFDVDYTVLQDWGDYGALLLKSSDTGHTMVSVLSDETNYSPLLHLVKDYGEGAIDTTTVKAIDGTYFLKPRETGDAALLSEGDGSGFIMKLDIPAEIKPNSVINRCVFRLSMLDAILPDEPMYVAIYRLESEFDGVGSVSINTSSLSISFENSTEFEEVDITTFVNNWHIGGYENHGLYIVPVNAGSSPNQCLVAVKDSVTITFTDFPEVR